MRALGEDNLEGEAARSRRQPLCLFTVS